VLLFCKLQFLEILTSTHTLLYSFRNVKGLFEACDPDHLKDLSSPLTGGPRIHVSLKRTVGVMLNVYFARITLRRFVLVYTYGGIVRLKASRSQLP
jgi:hypothetical protein